VGGVELAHVEPAKGARHLTTHRLVLAHLLILGVVGGSLYDIGTRQEHWPFSNYPMFSTIHKEPKLVWFRVFGVTSDNREIPLNSHETLWPLDQSRLPLGLRRLAQTRGNEARVRTAIADVLDRYERRRKAGELDGPALQGIRLYRVAWTLQPYASNLETPDSRELIAEAGPHQEAAR